MTRHSFRWGALAFGLFFLAAIGSWAVWKQDLLTPHELTLSASGVLIALGLVGIAATVLQTRSAKPTRSIPTPETTPEEHDDEETDPQP